MEESSVAPDRKPERGAAVVETAFITIFLLILVTGIIDVGRAIFTNISIQEAAQEAAVYAAFDESVTVADIAQRAVDSTSSPALNVGDVQVSCVPVPKSVKNGSRVSVTVSYSLDPITPFVGQWIGSFDLTKTAEAERFYDTCPA